jgi:hypothetical protein
VNRVGGGRLASLVAIVQRGRVRKFVVLGVGRQHIAI